MSHNRILLGLSAVALAGLIGVGAASAQTPSSPPAAKSIVNICRADLCIFHGVGCREVDDR